MGPGTTLADVLGDTIKTEFNMEVNNEFIRIRLQLLRGRDTVLAEGYNDNCRIYCYIHPIKDTLESFKEKIECLT